MSRDTDAARLVLAEPMRELVRSLEGEAETLDAISGDKDTSALLRRVAGRVRAAMEEGLQQDWMPAEDAAPFFGISDDGVRARCRRVWEAQGLAEKRGGRWYVHVDALPVAKVA